MFQVIEVFFEEPMRLLAMPHIRFEPGCIAAIGQWNDIPVCDLCNGETHAIGIVGNSIFVDSEEVDFEQFVEVWPQRMVFRTNNHEPGEYETGDVLHSSKNGLFTLEDSNSPILGRVISRFKDDKGIEGLWL